MNKCSITNLCLVMSVFTLSLSKTNWDHKIDQLCLPTNQNRLRIYHVSNHPKAKLGSHPSYLVVSVVANNYSYSFICRFKMSHFRMVLCAMDSFHLLQPTNFFTKKVSFQLRESKEPII